MPSKSPATRFISAFESTILPALENLMEEVDPDYVIVILGGEAPNHRILEIMTTDRLEDTTEERIRSAVSQSIPADVETTRLDIRFTIGRVERSATT